MRKVIPEPQKERAWVLYQEGFKIRDIARIIHSSYLSTWVITSGREKGLASAKEYEEYLAKRKGLASARDYREDLTKRKGLANSREYEEYLAKRKGLASARDYREDFARRRGCYSFGEYKRNLNIKRSTEPANIELSHLVESGLERMNKSEAWLAMQIGVNRGSVSLYKSGMVLPRNEILGKLLLALEIKTIPDDLFKLIEK